MNALAIPSFRQGGAGFYAAALIDGLSRSAEVRLTALVTAPLQEELRELATAARTEIARPRPRSTPRKGLNYLRSVGRPEVLDVGHTAPPPSAVVVHWPISFIHAPAPTPGCRRILTVLDLQHEFFPQFYSRRDRTLRRMRFPVSARAADHVIAISEFTARTVSDRYDVPPHRITAIPLACRAAFMRPDQPAADLLPASVANGAGPWFVYPASPLPAKNHARLLEAFDAFRHSHRAARLVLTGPRLHSWAPVQQEIAARRLGDAVDVLGHVADDRLRALYRAATGLVFPSLFEGFGLPVLEAFASGCPVAASASGSLPEVQGGVGYTFDATSTDSILAALEWLAGLGPADRSALAAAGRHRSDQFSTERMIERTVAVYRGVVA